MGFEKREVALGSVVAFPATEHKPGAEHDCLDQHGVGVEESADERYREVERCNEGLWAAPSGLPWWGLVD